MFDLKAIIGSWYRGEGVDRFETANPKEQIFNPLDFPSSLLQDMISRNVSPFTVQTINLSTAGQLEMLIPGFHVVMYGHDGSSNKAVNTTAYMELFWEKYTVGQTGFPMKHARGFTGVFSKIILKWPAQSNVYADVVIHSNMFQPWIDGESCT